MPPCAAPSTPYAPIQEITDDRNARIKQHYWDLWSLAPSDGMAALKISQEFEGENVVISEEDIESFCRVVGNEGEAYKHGHQGGTRVPMDFAIKLGWKVSRAGPQEKRERR